MNGCNRLDIFNHIATEIVKVLVVAAGINYVDYKSTFICYSTCPAEHRVAGLPFYLYCSYWKAVLINFDIYVFISAWVKKIQLPESIH